GAGDLADASPKQLATERLEQIQVGLATLPVGDPSDLAGRGEEHQVLGAGVTVAPLLELDAVVPSGEVPTRTAFEHGVRSVAAVAALVDDQVKRDQAQARAALVERRAIDPVAPGFVGLDR